jgi:large subunit ribosomal protein L12
MEYVYAAMLLHRAGKAVNEENINAVLNAAGVSPDAARVKALVAALEGVNIEDAIKTAPAFAAPAAAPAAQAPSAPAAAAKPEEKKEKEKEEKQKEEAALEGLGALFG